MHRRASTDCVWRGEDVTSGQDNHTPAHTEAKQNADTQQQHFKVTASRAVKATC